MQLNLLHRHFNNYSLRTLYKSCLYPRAYMNERPRRKLSPATTVVNVQNWLSSCQTMLVDVASIWRDHHYLICYWLTSCSAVLGFRNPFADYTSIISVIRWSLSLKENRTMYWDSMLLTVVQTKIRFNLIASTFKKIVFRSHIQNYESDRIWVSLPLETGSLTSCCTKCRSLSKTSWSGVNFGYKNPPKAEEEY
jgi:hypothetical protein